MNDKLVFLGLLYFIQGIPYGLQSSLLPVYLRGAGHSLTRISLTKILYFPWVLKVLWAPLVDRTGTKRCWLVGTVAGLALTCLVSATISPDVQYMGVAGSLLAMNMLASVQDIAADGAAVRLLRGQGELGLGNTVQVVGYKAGSVFAGGGLLAVIDVAGWGWMFALLACVYGGVALFVWGAPVGWRVGAGTGRRTERVKGCDATLEGVEEALVCARNAMDDVLRSHLQAR